MLKKYLIILLILFQKLCFAQNNNWSVHFQQTVIPQHKFKINAPYAGANSLSDTAETQTSITSTLFLARRLWAGATAFYNPELAGGSGLSQARGIAGFTNGECFRIGSSAPALYTARLFIKQDFPLTGDNEIEKTENDVNQLEGYQSTNRLSFSIGKFAISDVFDNNSYSHDPRSQLLNWALMSTGAWDYPANTRGYTWNIVAQNIKPKGAIRLATSLVPTKANGPKLNWNWPENQSNTVEIEHKVSVFRKAGVIRVLGFYTKTNMGNYARAAKMVVPDIIATRQPNRKKIGVSVNFEQHLSENSGLFFRTSWNDGKNETWAFTEIDKNIAFGYAKSNIFGRKNDNFTAGIAINGISKQHICYLAAGGYGFIIGDGLLPNYKTENILELNYSAKINPWLYISPDYQFIKNPAYNKDRGPVNTFALRFHVQV